MTYRDEDSAKQARVDALQDEVERLRQENEALRAQPKPGAENEGKNKKPKKPRGRADERAGVAEGADPQVARLQARAQNRVVTPSVGLGLWQAFGGMTLLALPCALMIALGGHVPDFPRGPVAMLGIVLGAPLVATNLYRLVFPHVPILWKGESGEYETHSRTPARRQLYFILSLVTYLAGTALLLTAQR